MNNVPQTTSRWESWRRFFASFQESRLKSPDENLVLNDSFVAESYMQTINDDISSGLM